MESSSCIEEPGSDTEKQRRPAPESLQRLGSGVSVVIDPTEAGVEAESRKLPSSRYKGVVSQPNGRWGAQIYEKHQRVWLGTFNEEAEAARGYDVAAQRFRGRDAVTNFRPLSSESDGDGDAAEIAFLGSHSKAEIVDMLRKHTYHDELLQSKRAKGSLSKRHQYQYHGGAGAGAGALSSSGPAGSSNSSGSGSGSIYREHLFDKAVTPSDVGKLNRLVIPKQHAEKHFPLQMTGDGRTSTGGVQLNFEDASGKVWRFRYSYWNSSQSYVLTKGWSRFVKEKSLKAGDVVSFRRSTGPEKQLFIDCSAQPPTHVEPVVRLFGVNIFKLPAVVSSGQWDVINWSGKRTRAMDLLPPPHHILKKQCSSDQELNLY